VKQDDKTNQDISGGDSDSERDGDSDGESEVTREST
jgi:hypothetical protein